VVYSGTSALLTTESDPSGLEENIDLWFAANGHAGAQYVGLPYRAAPAIGHNIVALSHELALSGRRADPIEIAADIAHESAFWQSKIARDKANPAGLGAENDDPYGKAIDFTEGGTVPLDEAARRGVRATIAHWMDYGAGTGEWSQFDPRYQNIKDAGWLGVAHVLNDLNGKWAYPGTTYGAQLGRRSEELRLYAGGTTLVNDDARYLWVPERYSEYGYDPYGSEGRGSWTIELLVMHITLGTDSLGFLTAQNQNSSHYLSWPDGTPRAQIVLERNAAWGAGHKQYNQRGIQFEVEKRFLESSWGDELYRNLANSIYPIAKRNALPLEYLGRNNGPGTRGFIGHMDVPDPLASGEWGGAGNHGDPGSNFDWNRFMGYLHELDKTVPIPPVDENVLHVVDNDGQLHPYVFRAGFRDWVTVQARARYAQDLNAGILSVTGLPLEDEWYGVDEHAYQRCERMVLQYSANTALPWDIVPLRRGTRPPKRKSA
jgi:hypothetical protein